MRERRVERRRVGAKTGACGVRQVGAASDGDRVREPNGGPMLPEELRPAPCECVYPRLIIPEAGEVLLGATVGQDIEEAQELPVDPARGGHGTWEEGVGSAIPVGVPVPVALHLFACLVLQEPVGVMVS